MSKKNTAQELARHWEQAVERAEQDNVQDSEVSTEMWNSAAGLQVESGLRAGHGLWSASCKATCGSCAQTCGCINPNGG